MDPALSQSETTPPVHALDENPSGTIREDAFDPSHPNVVNALPSLNEAPPVHALDENPSGTIREDAFDPSHPNVPRTTVRIDTSNLSPSAVNVLPSSNEAVQPPLPVQPDFRRKSRRNNDINRFPTTQVQDELGWIVPIQRVGQHTVAERLKPTLTTAITQKNKHATYARWAGLALNTAIGLQVLLGSLTTGLSALAVSGGKSTAVATTILGALSTLVASFLARARGSGQPELSITRTRALDQFIRKCEAFMMDHGHITGHTLNKELLEFRREFEEILGNDTNKEPPPAS